MRLYAASLVAVLHLFSVCGSGHQTIALPAQETFSSHIFSQEGVVQHNERFPYIVSVRRQGSGEHICSGVLIHSEYAATPGHCVDPLSNFGAGDNPFVYIGAMSVTNTTNAEIHHVGSIIHGEWKEHKRQLSPHNIALLKLEKASTAPIPRMLKDSSSLQDGLTRSMLGYGGKNIQLGDPIFDDLKMEGVQVISGTTCNRTHAWKGQIEDSLFCGINAQKRASCVIDSGSPMVFLDAVDNPSFDDLMGLNLHGAACGEPDAPDIFLDLRPLKSWINDVIATGTDVPVSSSKWTCAQITVSRFKIDVICDEAVHKCKMDVFAGQHRLIRIDDAVSLLASIATPSGAWLIVAAFFKKMRSLSAKMIILWIIATAISTSFGLRRCTG